MSESPERDIPPSAPPTASDERHASAVRGLEEGLAALREAVREAQLLLDA